MVVPDIHGRHEALSNAFDKALKEGYDKIVLLGDYVDSFNRTNEDMYRVLDIVTFMAKNYPDKVVALLGNHDYQYMFPDGPYRCSGHRPDAAPQFHYMFNENKDLFKIAHKEGNYLFSHAGVQRKWFEKYSTTLMKYADLASIDPNDDIDEVCNMIHQTSERWKLAEVGTKRGGMRYDYGGPIWCDQTEMMSYGPLKGFHQIVGHTPQQFVNKQTKFEGDKHYNNTSVTFCDILNKKEQFLTVEVIVEDDQTIS